jgi:hypothetical protein
MSAFVIGLDVGGGHGQRGHSSHCEHHHERPAEAADLRMISEADTTCWAPSLLAN